MANPGEETSTDPRREWDTALFGRARCTTSGGFAAPFDRLAWLIESGRV